MVTMNRVNKNFFLFLLLLCFGKMNAIKIDRVIVASDANPMYLDFWPLVARAWRDLMGVKPVLALIADRSVKVDESIGDVIRFDPIPGVPTGFYAQVVRLLLPAYFENEVCITSDIDMLPIKKEFFIGKEIERIPADRFVVYGDGWYDGTRFPICYLAGQGALFKEILNINEISDIPLIVKKWFELNLGWDTDELVVSDYIKKWHKYKTHCVRLGRGHYSRIDRSNWQWKKKLLDKGRYIDSHMIRPYKQHKEKIDALARALGLS